MMSPEMRKSWDNLMLAVDELVEDGTRPESCWYLLLIAKDLVTPKETEQFLRSTVERLDDGRLTFVQIDESSLALINRADCSVVWPKDARYLTKNDLLQSDGSAKPHGEIPYQRAMGTA
jgi:hypothetical protein